MPDRCPEHDESQKTPCRIGPVRYRHRKTGPGYPLAVRQCHLHRLAYTLYPQGFAPYLRVPVIKVAPDGSRVVSGGGEGGKPADPLQREFEGTRFSAALDAAEGKAWPRDSRTDSTVRSWGQQGRWLAETALIAGVAPGIAASSRDQLAQVLTVDALVLREQARGLEASSGYREIGAAVVSVLREIRRWADLAFRLLFAGHLVGRWGRPVQWQPSRRCLRTLPFPSPGTARPP